MKRTIIIFLVLCSLTATAQNKVVRREGANKNVSVSPPRKTATVGNVAKKSTTSSHKKQATHTINASYSYGVLTVNGVRYEMVKVDAGTFTMGSTSGYGDETPVHKVTLADSYYMGKTEVTQSLWKAVMGSNPSSFKGDRKPVENVSWNDCQTFIKKLNQATGKNFRLPTEAEWEFAARGGNNSKHYQYSGSNNIDDVAWYTDNSSSTTHDVATKSPNELGLYDMSGNVWEWCQDWYGNYSSPAQTNPASPSSGSCRVSRGGGWCIVAGYCRSSSRNFNTPVNRFDGLGFRLVLSEEGHIAVAESKPKVSSISSRNSEIQSKSQLNASYSNGVLTINAVSYEMVRVAGGMFTMGATSEMQNPGDNEKPTHQVTLTHNYFMGKTEVTQALWKAVMGSNPSCFIGDNKPVEQVSWGDCQTFISKLNDATGKQFRLPTEAEWEFAARGGNSSRHYQYSGSNSLDDVAWYSDNSRNTTHNVALKSPNELGLYDMSGNVMEWCSDCYGSYGSFPQTNPTGLSEGANRVGRGGSWGSSARFSRSSNRYFNRTDRADENIGFRLALSE